MVTARRCLSDTVFVVKKNPVHLLVARVFFFVSYKQVLIYIRQLHSNFSLMVMFMSLLLRFV